ncbi:MAG: ABC transporter permease, partial [Treponema sp.]|nr:ABC transporter permease [Treponema sp.]
MNSKAPGKVLAFLASAALALLAALGFPTLLLWRSPARNLLLVSPLEAGSPALDPQKLRRIVEEEFLLTYEVRRRIQARTAAAVCPATLIGTNSLYPALTLHPMLRGGFFTGRAEKGKNREAVLNRAAAFRIFGSDAVAGRTLTIEDAPWLVTGVMDDGEEDSPRVYIPAAAAGEGPRSLLVLLGGGVDAAQVKNTLMT